MAMHWTEFPEKIEKFGDLFSIMDTLHSDYRRDLIAFGAYAKESEQSAYTVEYGDGGLAFVTRPDRIPGLERIRTYAEREFGVELSTGVLRQIRGRASEALDITSAEVDQLTLEQVADALALAEKELAGGAAADPFAEFRWLKVTQVARVFALNPGQVSKLADTGTFATNGKTGHDRRVDALSVVRRELARLDRQGGADEPPCGE
jgi:hypothetical protein